MAALLITYSKRCLHLGILLAKPLTKTFGNDINSIQMATSLFNAH